MSDINNPYNESNFSIEPTGSGTFVVRSDSKRFGKDAVVFESADRPDCVSYISDRQVVGQWRFYIIPDIKTWATNAPEKTPIEYYDTFAEAESRFKELRGADYNNERQDVNQDGIPYARLTLGIDRKDKMSAADILHVTDGSNYMVDDFTRMVNLNTDAAVLNILSEVSKEIGFDRVHPFFRNDKGTYTRGEDMSFADWNAQYNTFFAAGASIDEHGEDIRSAEETYGLVSRIEEFIADNDPAYGYAEGQTGWQNESEARNTLFNMLTARDTEWLNIELDSLIKYNPDLTEHVNAFREELKPYQPAVNEHSDHISVDGHVGTWYVIDKLRLNGKDYFLLEHETYGDEAAGVIVDAGGGLVADDVYDGFDDLINHLANHMTAGEQDAYIEQHANGELSPYEQKLYDTLIDIQAARKTDEHEAEYGADGYRAFGVSDVVRPQTSRTGIVGVVSWANGEKKAFTGSKEYISEIKEEIDYSATSGFKFKTITRDAETRKAVDDIVYDLYGDENPNGLEYYRQLEAEYPENDLERVFSYLCSDWGIEAEVVKEAYNQGQISDNLRDDPKDFRLYGRDDVTSVAVFSNPLEALSHASISRLMENDFESVDRIAPSGDAFAYLKEHLDDNPGIKNVMLCTDADQAGKLKDKLIEAGYTPENGYHCERNTPAPTGCKDYNEYLLSCRAAQEGQRTADQEREPLAAQEEDGFFPEAEPEEHEM